MGFDATQQRLVMKLPLRLTKPAARPRNDLMTTLSPSNPTARQGPLAVRRAKYAVGSVVRHRFYPFRGVIFDIDPEFNNTEEWWESIPEDIRPRKDQPFYHLLAENSDTTYIAYVSEQNLLPDDTGVPVRHPQVKDLFAREQNGTYRPLFLRAH